LEHLLYLVIYPDRLERKFTEARWSSGKCAGLKTGDMGSNVSPVTVANSFNVLGQGVNSQVPRSVKPFIPPRSMIWDQLRLDINVLRAATRTACGHRLTVLVGATWLACHRPLCALRHASVVDISSLPTCNAVLASDLFVSVVM
jgi:hypothetical protein